MAQQKSEDRVVLEGGVMPVEPAGSSLGGQGKAVPVEEAAVQLCLLIATAEVPRGSPGAIGVPKAIVNAQTGPSVTMEEVASRLTASAEVDELTEGDAALVGVTEFRVGAPELLAAEGEAVHVVVLPAERCLEDLVQLIQAGVGA